MKPHVLLLCPFTVDWGLVSKSIELYSSECVRILLPLQEAGTASSYGVKWIHALPRDFHPWDEEQFSSWLRIKCKEWEIDTVLASATVELRSIMPNLAFKLSAGLTADCTGISLDENHRLLQTRPAFGGSVIADIISRRTIQMATVRPGIYPPVTRPILNASVQEETPDISDERVQFLKMERSDGENDLLHAPIVVAGGLGIGSKEGFERLACFAEKIGASLGASRSAVDAGFASYARQIGMTGLIIRPKLYIAVGISGAVQHLAGMSQGEKIVAINSDPKAKIFQYADYGIVDHWENVIDKLEELL